MAFPTQSIDFEKGSTQYAAISNASQTGLSFTDIMTLEGWFKFESNTGTYLISKRAPTSNQRSYSLSTAITTINLDTFFNGLNTGCSVSVAWTPSLATWYHIAVTKNGTSVKFYVNGVQQGTTQTGTNGTISTGTAAFEIATSSTDPGGEYDGRMVLVRAWNTERTQTEINNNKCLILGATGGLVGEWGFSGAYTDNSGNGNTLTGVNTPTFGSDVPNLCSGVAESPNFFMFF